MEIFAKRLKELRLDRNLSLDNLAQQCGISKSTLQHWEQADREPKLGAVITLAKFFDVTIDYLAGLE